MSKRTSINLSILSEYVCLLYVSMLTMKSTAGAPGMMMWYHLGRCTVDRQKMIQKYVVAVWHRRVREFMRTGILSLSRCDRSSREWFIGCLAATAFEECCFSRSGCAHFTMVLRRRSAAKPCTSQNRRLPGTCPSSPRGNLSDAELTTTHPEMMSPISMVHAIFSKRSSLTWHGHDFQELSLEA